MDIMQVLVNVGMVILLLIIGIFVIDIVFRRKVENECGGNLIFYGVFNKDETEFRVEVHPEIADDEFVYERAREMSEHIQKYYSGLLE